MAKLIRREVLASDMFKFRFKEFASSHDFNEAIDTLVKTVITGVSENSDAAFGEELKDLSEAEKIQVTAECIKSANKREFAARKNKIEHKIQSEMETEYRESMDQKDQEIAKLKYELEKSLPRPNPLNVQFTLQFLLLVSFCAALCAYLVFVEGARRSDISIEYNVGAIIFGILGGGGVAAAGIAFAIHRIRTRD